MKNVQLYLLTCIHRSIVHRPPIFCSQEKQAKRKITRADEEKRLAQKKKEEEERRQREIGEFTLLLSLVSCCLRGLYDYFLSGEFADVFLNFQRRRNNVIWRKRESTYLSLNFIYINRLRFLRREYNVKKMEPRTMSAVESTILYNFIFYNFLQIRKNSQSMR